MEYLLLGLIVIAAILFAEWHTGFIFGKPTTHQATIDKIHQDGVETRALYTKAVIAAWEQEAKGKQEPEAGMDIYSSLDAPDYASKLRNIIDGQETAQSIVKETIIDRDREYCEALGLSDEDVNVLQDKYEESGNWPKPAVMLTMPIDGETVYLGIKASCHIWDTKSKRSLIMAFTKGNNRTYSQGGGTGYVCYVDADLHQKLVAKLKERKETTE